MRAKFDKLTKKASRPQLVKALKAGGRVLQQAIEERTPVRHDSPSGDALAPGQLRGDIHVAVNDDGAIPTVSVGPGPDTAKVMGWLEYGHAVAGSNNGSAEGKGLKFVPAQPVMRPAWEASRDEAMQTVIDGLRDETGE